MVWRLREHSKVSAMEIYVDCQFPVKDARIVHFVLDVPNVDDHDHDRRVGQWPAEYCLLIR